MSWKVFLFFLLLSQTAYGSRYFYNNGGMVAGSVLFWQQGVGPGSEYFWNNGLGPGSRYYWQTGIGLGSQTAWEGAQLHGSIQYWNEGTDEGSLYFWMKQAAPGSCYFWDNGVGPSVIPIPEIGLSFYFKDGQLVAVLNVMVGADFECSMASSQNENN